MIATRNTLLLAAALAFAGPLTAAAQTAAPGADGPTIDETQGKPGTQSGAEPGSGVKIQPDAETTGGATGSTGIAPETEAGDDPNQKPLDQDTQAEDSGLQKQEGQPGTQSGAQPPAE